MLCLDYSVATVYLTDLCLNALAVSDVQPSNTLINNNSCLFAVIYITTMQKNINQETTSTVCLSVCLSVCLLACLPACVSVCLPACLPVCLSVCLSVCLPVYLSLQSVCLSICLSICLSVQQANHSFVRLESQSVDQLVSQSINPSVILSLNWLINPSVSLLTDGHIVDFPFDLHS